MRRVTDEIPTELFEFTARDDGVKCHKLNLDHTVFRQQLMALQK